MHCIDTTSESAQCGCRAVRALPQPVHLRRLPKALGTLAALVTTAWLAGCSTPMPPAPWTPPAAPAAPTATPPTTAAGAPVATPQPGQLPAPAAPAQAAPAAPAAEPPARNWDEYRLRAARRIAEANAGDTFAGAVPQRLASIPVMQVRLNRDGSVREVQVLRTPKFEPQTVQLAQRAIRRVGNFGPVGHLPQPWEFSETFLYNDDLKFQLRTLAEAP